jgi:hypothetical protein
MLLIPLRRPLNIIFNEDKLQKIRHTYSCTTFVSIPGHFPPLLEKEDDHGHVGAVCKNLLVSRTIFLSLSLSLSLSLAYKCRSNYYFSPMASMKPAKVFF